MGYMLIGIWVCNGDLEIGIQVMGFGFVIGIRFLRFEFGIDDCGLGLKLEYRLKITFELQFCLFDWVWGSCINEKISPT